MKIRNAALAAVGLLFCALTSYAQITALEGYVKGTDGKPLNNAQIAIDRLDIKGHWTCKTDKKGHYIYTGLQMGMYTISLMVDGKVADAIKNIRTHPGDPILNNFDLSKLQESQAATRTRVRAVCAIFSCATRASRSCRLQPLSQPRRTASADLRSSSACRSTLAGIPAATASWT